MLRRNLDGNVRETTFMLVAFLYAYLSLLDCVTTSAALTRGLRERNPLAAALYAHYGVASLYALKFIVVGVVLCGLASLPRRIALLTTIVFCTGVAVVVIDNLAALRTLG